MRNYKINRKNDQKVPTRETIEKYKDFSRLTHAYDHYTRRPKKPLYKDKRMFLFILLIALMAYLLAEVFNQEEQESQKPNIEQPEGDSGE